MQFNFAILDPRPQGAEANAKIFDSEQQVLGIEVTIPALASKCSLGNIDPQHSGGMWQLKYNCPSCGAVYSQWTRDGKVYSSCTTMGCCSSHGYAMAAIECCVDVKLPEIGSTLVTVRADLDSVGAMAIMELRARAATVAQAAVGSGTPLDGVDPSTWYPTGQLMSRITAVGNADKFARGEYPGPRALPTTNNPWPSEGAADSTQSLAAINAAVSDFKLSIAERVELMINWLLNGEDPDGYRERVEAERQSLITALEDGTIKVRNAGAGRIAIVESTHRAATMVGYSSAPVVVALNPAFKLGAGEPHRKFTICAYSTDYADIKSALAELAVVEHGWAGSPTIGGSPQGISSTLTVEQVVEVVSRHLK